MASEEEDEELAALRFAALASMKSKQKPVEEDEDLKALKEAALRTLESTTFTPYPPTHLQHSQSHSPNYYNAPQPQYGHGQYSHPPSHYHVSNIPTTMYQQNDVHFRGNSNLGPAPIQNVAGIRDNKPGSRSGTPPLLLGRGGRGGGRGNSGGGRGNPRGLPPRANNLIVISPMGREEDKSVKQPGNIPQKDASSSKPVLLRPQDKWCAAASDSNSLTASPSRPKASGKFSRFDTSSSESEDSESDEEDTKEETIEKSRGTDAESASDSERKMAADSDRDSSDNESAKSDKGSSSSDSDSKNSASVSQDSDSSSDSDSDNGSENSDSEEVMKQRVKQASETEEEKQERREADRLLEETMDRRHVLNADSDKEEKPQPKWTNDNFSVATPTRGDSGTNYDLSHKLTHHRARVKEQNGKDLKPGDLSSKLTNRRNRKTETDTNNSAPSINADFQNITIQKSIEEVSDPPKPKLSDDDLLKLEARKRKFEASPVSGAKEGKKTISLKGIVPRSKKRQKENPRSRSSSPVPKCYSRDLERYEKKKKATRERHKSSSKENRAHKKEVIDQSKVKADPKHKSKDHKGRRNSGNKVTKSENDSSDDVNPEDPAQISDSESEDEGRSWRTEANKNRVNLKGRGRAVRELDNSSRNRRGYQNDSWSRRTEDRRRHNEESRINVILPKHRREERHRNVKVMAESETDSDGPKMPSSVVLPGRGRVDTNKEKFSKGKEESESDSDMTESSQQKPQSRKRTVMSTDSPERGRYTKASRRVTTDPDSQLTTTFKRKSSFESKDTSGLSVTLDSENRTSELSRSRSQSSVHERLGRQIDVPETNVDGTKSKHGEGEKRKKKSEGRECTTHKEMEESPKGDDELELRIQKIKEKNAAILKRQEEVRQDKERYG